MLVGTEGATFVEGSCFQMEEDLLKSVMWVMLKKGEGDVLEYLATIQQEGSMEEYVKELEHSKFPTQPLITPQLQNTNMAMFRNKPVGP